MKPCNTIRQNLVRPKDKRPLSDNTGEVYNIACKQCPGRFIGKTGRKLGVRVKEHQDEVEKANKLTATPDRRVKPLRICPASPPSHSIPFHR